MNRLAIEAVAITAIGLMGAFAVIVVGTRQASPIRQSVASIAASTPVLSTPAVAPPTTAPVRIGKREVNLGTRSYFFGSQGQARELLALIEREPGLAEYSIAYDTGQDAVVFGCNLVIEVLARVHLKRDDHGTRELWRGYVMDRLRNGAAGGSMNDTPAGKSLVNFETF